MEKQSRCKANGLHMGLLQLISSVEELHHLKSLDLIKDLLQADMEGRVIILDAPRLPVEAGVDEGNTDVYCPVCKANLSGVMGDEWIEGKRVLQCHNCGTYLDDTEISTPDPMHELKLTFAKKIGNFEGRFWIEVGSAYPYCIETHGIEYGYRTLDALLADMLRVLETYVKPTSMQYAIDFIKENVNPKKFSPSDRVWKRSE